MSDRSNHPEQLLAGYALGDLTPEEAELVQQLLRDRPELHTELQQIQAVLAAIPYGLEGVQSPPRPELKQRILAQARGAGPISLVQPLGAVLGRHRPWGYLVGSVAAVLAIAVGLQNFRLHQQLHQTEAALHDTTVQLSQSQAQLASQQDLIALLQDGNTHMVTLQGQAQMAKACGNLVMRPDQPEAILILHRLKPLPAGQQYQLWTMSDQAQPIASGQFSPNDQGVVFVKVPIQAAQSLKALAVTIESEAAPRSPQGPMVMTSKL